jgi:hypothetical protein
MPYTHATKNVLGQLATLRPQTLAVMHGSSFAGDGAKQLTGLAGVIEENFGR